MSTIRIPLNGRKYPGHFTVIDADDWDIVSPYLWRAVKYGDQFYAQTSIRRPDSRRDPDDEQRS